MIGFGLKVGFLGVSVKNWGHLEIYPTILT
jgi:hypothetical protein